MLHVGRELLQANNTLTPTNSFSTSNQRGSAQVTGIPFLSLTRVNVVGLKIHVVGLKIHLSPRTAVLHPSGNMARQLTDEAVKGGINTYHADLHAQAENVRDCVRHFLLLMQKTGWVGVSIVLALAFVFSSCN